MCGVLVWGHVAHVLHLAALRLDLQMPRSTLHGEMRTAHSASRAEGKTKLIKVSRLGLPPREAPLGV